MDLKQIGNIDLIMSVYTEQTHANKLQPSSATDFDANVKKFLLKTDLSQSICCAY